MPNAVMSTFLVLSIAATASAQKITKESLTSQGTARTYYLFVPDSAKEKPAPLLILLHGSGRDGKILIEHWQSLAKKEGIILAGPDAIVRQGWGPDDGPLFIRQVIEAVQTDHAVDRRAMYVFGHSAGAIFGISMGVLESEYFAAVAVHAGSVSPSVVPFIAKAPRKIPIAVWVGTERSRVSGTASARQSRVAQAAGVPGRAHRNRRPHAQLLRTLLGNQQSCVGLPSGYPAGEGSAVPGLRHEEMTIMKPFTGRIQPRVKPTD